MFQKCFPIHANLPLIDRIQQINFDDLIKFTKFIRNKPLVFILLLVVLCFNSTLLCADELEKNLVRTISFDDDENIKQEGKLISGKFGKAFNLNGSRDYIDLGDLSLMEDYTFTISFWYKSRNGSGWIFSEGNSSSNIPICGLAFSTNIKMFCRSSASRSMQRKKTISYNINNGQWHHVALTGDGEQMGLYIDGILQGFMGLPEKRPNFDMTSLGRLGRRNSGGYISANLDEIRIYNSALSFSAIRSLAQGPTVTDSSDSVTNASPASPQEPSADTSLTPRQPVSSDPQPSLSNATAAYEFPEANLSALFGKVPSLGVHPRILFGPAELPAIRSRLNSTGSGKKAYALIKRNADRLRNGELKTFFNALKAGDRAAFSKIPSCFWKDKARMVMSYEAFILLIEDINGSRANNFANALTTFAQITGGFYKKDICNWSGNDHYALVDLAYSYDFAYGKLNPDQRVKIRQTVTSKLRDKLGYGMDLPKSDRIAPPNYQMHGMNHYILNLAFEGEPGFSESLNNEGESLAWDFMTSEIHGDGTPREDMHYFHFGMEHGAEALIAMSRRGHNIINHPNYRRMLNWYIYSVEPYGYKFSTHGDTIRQDGGLMDNYTLLKYTWPDNVLFDFAWRHRMGDNYQNFNQFHDYLLPAIFGADMTAASKDAASLGLPLAFHSGERGFSVARSGWGPDALSLHFSARTDLHTTGHYHSDHNDFTLSARGRDWVKDWGYHSYRDFQHNLVRIDGRGQGYFPAYGEFPKFIHHELITVSVGDAKYAYSYRWVHKSRKGATDYKKYSWQLDPNVNPPGRSNTTWRSEWNPVQKAFRTVSLVRGANPYVLIVDDIKKDNKSRLYEWLLQMLETNTVVSSGDNEMILKQGQEQLLVRVIHANGRVRSSFENFRVERMVDNGGSDRVHANIGVKKRLIFSSETSDPGFKVLLYPHREGMALPSTSTGDDGKTIGIEFPGQNDNFNFFDVEGRSAFHFQRNGDSVLRTD